MEQSSKKERHDIFKWQFPAIASSVVAESWHSPQADRRTRLFGDHRSPAGAKHAVARATAQQYEIIVIITSSPLPPATTVDTPYKALEHTVSPSASSLQGILCTEMLWQPMSDAKAGRQLICEQNRQYTSAFCKGRDTDSTLTTSLWPVNPEHTSS